MSCHFVPTHGYRDRQLVSDRQSTGRLTRLSAMKTLKTARECVSGDAWVCHEQLSDTMVSLRRVRLIWEVSAMLTSNPGAKDSATPRTWPLLRDICVTPIEPKSGQSSRILELGKHT